MNDLYKIYEKFVSMNRKSGLELGAGCRFTIDSSEERGNSMRCIRENYTDDGRVHLQGYLQDTDLVFRGRRARAAVLICPGGAYQYCAVREMDPIAMAFASKGYHTFILTYSVGEYARGFQPLEEVDWAIRTIREHAGDWEVIPDQIVIAGFSAGGHLALAGGLKAENRADVMILGYPVADTQLLYGPDVSEDPLVRALIGEQPVTGEDLEAVNMVSCVTRQSPPMFVFNTFHDEQLAREHCLELVSRYSELNVPCEYHLFQEGLHGLSLADEVTAAGRPQMEEPQAAKWFGLAADWLRRVLQEMEHGRDGRVPF